MLIFSSLFNVFGLNLLFAAELQIDSYSYTNHKLIDISGKQITLGQVIGDKGTLVIFSCNTCPWVLKWEKRYVDISKQYMDKGVGIIAELNVYIEVQLMITPEINLKLIKHSLKNALDQMLAGEQITKPVSKALGCSIKF